MKVCYIRSTYVLHYYPSDLDKGQSNRGLFRDTIHLETINSLLADLEPFMSEDINALEYKTGQQISLCDSNCWSLESWWCGESVPAPSVPSTVQKNLGPLISARTTGTSKWIIYEPVKSTVGSLKVHKHLNTPKRQQFCSLDSSICYYCYLLDFYNFAHSCSFTHYPLICAAIQTLHCGSYIKICWRFVFFPLLLLSTMYTLICRSRSLTFF